ncbi:MAG: PHP domain-containing protein [Betaproteobacteria bacterium]|nr:PHP domain-containing protein [Betaproteobacteria bacterium]
MLNLDLHSHSIFSDGTLTPESLVARAAQRGVAVLALTDHDHTGGLPAARAAAAARGIRLIDGVEISVTWHGQTIHILGLAIDAGDTALQTGLAATRGGRIERARKMAAAFDALGIAGSFEGAQQFADNPQLIGRTHFARFLMQQGAVKDIKTAFKRFLGGGQPCYVPHQWTSLSDAVNWINGSGGVAVIAHPGRYPLDTAQMRALLAEFRELGGAAIEVVSSSHKPHQPATFAAQAREFGLAASAGSDFHSPQEGYHDLGGLPALPHGCAPVWRDWEAAQCEVLNVKC